jgi:hypothetical protein
MRRTTDMKNSWKVLLIAVAMVFGGYATQTLLAETPPTVPNYQDDCDVDEQSDCAETCLTEHNCCIKSCNWVDPKAKTKCIKHCKSILKKCHQECDEEPAADEATESAPERNPRSESGG